MVVEGPLRAHAALLTLLPTALRDREGGAAALAGRHTGAILHGVRAGDRCRETGFLLVKLLCGYSAHAWVNKSRCPRLCAFLRHILYSELFRHQKQWEHVAAPSTRNIYVSRKHVGLLARRDTLTTVGYVRAKVDDDGEPAAVVSVVGQRRAEAGRPTLTGV